MSEYHDVPSHDCSLMQQHVPDQNEMRQSPEQESFRRHTFFPSLLSAFEVQPQDEIFSDDRDRQMSRTTKVSLQENAGHLCLG